MIEATNIGAPRKLTILNQHNRTVCRWFSSHCARCLQKCLTSYHSLQDLSQAFPTFSPPLPHGLMANTRPPGLFLLVAQHLLAHRRGHLLPEATELPEPALPPRDRTGGAYGCEGGVLGTKDSSKHGCGFTMSEKKIVYIPEI